MTCFFSLGLFRVCVRKHAWLLVFLFLLYFLLCVSGLGFQVCMCAQASCICMHTRSMHMHIVGMCMHTLCIRTHILAQKP